MTYTVIMEIKTLPYGDRLRREVHHGANDVDVAWATATKKFGPTVKIVAIVPGNHEVYYRPSDPLSPRLNDDRILRARSSAG